MNEGRGKGKREAGDRVPALPASRFPLPVWEMPRDKIILACNECKNRNYFTTKNKRLHPERVEWKKYCPRCNKHQVHKETK
jgi:large subunit ribosomal protein L33